MSCILSSSSVNDGLSLLLGHFTLQQQKTELQHRGAHCNPSAEEGGIGVGCYSKSSQQNSCFVPFGRRHSGGSSVP